MITAEHAKSVALDITQAFPEATTVQEAYDLAIEAKMFANDNEALAVWGRLSRLLPQGA